MTGPYDGIIGTERDAVIKRFLTQLPVRFEATKKGKAQLSGVVIDIDQKTGQATKIERILITADQPFFE